ncbi:MAG: hypothetical protein K2F81_01520, partial [Ruminococcus sp.]|nr:hypothetical protein [Ruminococcus sp.]
MKIYTIAQLFYKYNDIIPKALENGIVYKIIFNEKENKIIAFVKFDTLQKFNEIDKFEREISAALKLNKFELQSKYTPDMLCGDYFPELVKYLKADCPVINGFFDGAEAKYENGTFIVNMLRGGVEFLKKAGIESKFSA